MIRGLVIALALAVSGCASVGTNYNEAAAASVRPGMTQAEVIGLLGAPNSRTTMPDGGQILMWMHSRANSLTGNAAARSVSFLFDGQGRVVRPITNTQTQMRY